MASHIPTPLRLSAIFMSLMLMGTCLLHAAKTPSMRAVVDMRGVEVKIPKEIHKVATIDDGFIEAVMTHLGVIDKVVAIGSWSMKRDYKYDFTTSSGEKYSHRGWNTMKYLHPHLNELPCVNSPQGNIINFETLAKSDPDLVILRVGDCTLGAPRHDESSGDKIKQTIKTIEELGIPVVVIYSPSYYKKAEINTIKSEMEVIGDIFEQKSKASALANYLHNTEEMIRRATANIKEGEKTRLLYLGLNPDVRKKGAAGSVFGTNTPESYIIENVVGAKNAFNSLGFGVPISVEQIYAIDPDVIILPTFNGYHPPREIYEAPYFDSLSELRAIKERKVYSMPWTPMNCSRRMEYPLDMLIIAKAAYPERFKDISVYDFALKFYSDVYGVDAKEAKGLAQTQILGWMEGEGVDGGNW